MKDRIYSLLSQIYNHETSKIYAKEILNKIDTVKNSLLSTDIHQKTANYFPLDESDTILITYGNQFSESGEYPLSTLRNFLTNFTSKAFSSVHILPFFPYSSDDGFSVIDFTQVNTEFGSWPDIEALASEYRIMADLVLNHCSVSSPWFQGFLNGDPHYKNYFIALDPDTDVSEVIRPRAHPLLTPFKTKEGIKYVWTTFSDDQVDLNVANPHVLLEMVHILLLFLQHGIRIIRLDAIAYVWKELGTPCLHHPKTHLLVKLFRAILEHTTPEAVLITETNVPHNENISYFGNGSDEAHMVYQFSLPPLVIDAFLRGNSERLQEWASSLKLKNKQTAFFNFLASHDGIGLLPAKNVLSETEINGLIDNTLQNGGKISYKATANGKIPYEMNITYLDAVSPPHFNTDDRISRFLASQSIMLTMPGVPGIYIHSLLGSENCITCLEQTGHNRSINREKFILSQIVSELNSEHSLRCRIFRKYLNMLEKRRAEPAFHPTAQAVFLPTEKQIFAILRISGIHTENILCVHNLTNTQIEFHPPANTNLRDAHQWKDILSNETFDFKKEDTLGVPIKPYGIYWLKPISS